MMTKRPIFLIEWHNLIAETVKATLAVKAFKTAADDQFAKQLVSVADRA